MLRRPPASPSRAPARAPHAASAAPLPSGRSRAPRAPHLAVDDVHERAQRVAPRQRLRGGLHHGCHQLHLERRVLQLLRRAAHPAANQTLTPTGEDRVRTGPTHWRAQQRWASPDAAHRSTRCPAARLMGGRLLPTVACGEVAGRVPLTIAPQRMRRPLPDALRECGSPC